MARVKLVSESLQEHTLQIEPVDVEISEGATELNESSKGLLQKFMKAPDKYPKSFLAAFAAQFGKKGGDKLKKVLAGLDVEVKKKLAQQALKALEDSKKGYAWVTVKGGKIVGAGAMGVEKGELGSELGA